jgi:energy-coupling factor transport system substrate-specific component
MNNKLQVKDLINVGIFTALYFVCFFATGMLGYIPIFMVLIPVICPLVAGIPFMLYLAKVKKFGMITSTGTILGLFMFLIGHPWPVLVTGILFGLLGDLSLKIGKYSNIKSMFVGYIVFSEWILGALAPLFFMRDSYFATIREGYGDTYADTLMSLTPIWMFFVMAVMVIIGALIGSLLGKATLKKHFKRAGIA